MTDRRPIVAANWKMHNTHLQAIETVQKLSYLVDRGEDGAAEVVICPPFTALRSLQTLIQSDRLSFLLGAQDVFWEEKGAYTGEIAPGMLAALDVRYVIVGHSERREHMGETDEWVARKVRATFDAGMTPIMCVGESLAEREGGQALDRVLGQVRAGLQKVGPEEAARLVVAYEPIWAIGTGRACAPGDAGEVAAAIRGALGELYSADAAAAARVQYGGSVKAGNVRDFMAHPEIDGALVGGASLDPEELALIIGGSGA